MKFKIIIFAISLIAALILPAFSKDDKCDDVFFNIFCFFFFAGAISLVAIIAELVAKLLK